MRAFYVLVVCTFAAAVINSCESKEHQARVTGFHNRYPRRHSAGKTVEENKVKVSAISSEAHLPELNVNQEEIVKQAKIAAERAKAYPKSIEEWNEREMRKQSRSKPKKPGQKKTTEAPEVSIPNPHSQDEYREEMKVHAASPITSMTFDEKDRGEREREKKDQEERRRRKLRKTTEEPEVSIPNTHSQDEYREEIKVHAASPITSMTFDEWKKEREEQEREEKEREEKEREEKEWENEDRVERNRRKLKKTTEEPEVALLKAHSQDEDREEMKVHAASPISSMTFDEWEKKFNDARKSLMDAGKINIQQITRPAALPLKAYSKSRKDLEQEIDEGVKIASPLPRPYSYHRALVGGYNKGTVAKGVGVKEALLKQEQERIKQRYNEAKQNAMTFDHDAMMLHRDDVKEKIHQEAEKNGYHPLGRDLLFPPRK